MDIGTRIKELRKARGMTQKELAKKTSLSIASIQGYEQKKYKPKLNTIAKIAVALDVLLLDLVDTDDPILQNEITAINIPDLNYINSVLRSLTDMLVIFRYSPSLPASIFTSLNS